MKAAEAKIYLKVEYTHYEIQLFLESLSLHW